MDSRSAATPYAVDIETLAAERLSSAFPRKSVGTREDEENLKLTC